MFWITISWPSIWGIWYFDIQFLIHPVKYFTSSGCKSCSMMNNLGFFSLLTFSILLLTETASVRAISRLYKNDKLFFRKVKMFLLISRCYLQSVQKNGYKFVDLPLTIWTPQAKYQETWIGSKQLIIYLIKKCKA